MWISALASSRHCRPLPDGHLCIIAGGGQGFYSVRRGEVKPIVNPDVVKTFQGSSVSGESCSTWLQYARHDQRLLHLNCFLKCVIPLMASALFLQHHRRGQACCARAWTACAGCRSAGEKAAEMRWMPQPALQLATALVRRVLAPPLAPWGLWPPPALHLRNQSSATTHNERRSWLCRGL